MVGFAGSTADAMTLLERLEKKLGGYSFLSESFHAFVPLVIAQLYSYIYIYIYIYILTQRSILGNC